MRGSTAGLTDTLVGGSRLHSLVLEVADVLFSSIILSPCVVSYWRSTWALLDLYLVPDNYVLSASISAIGAFAGYLLMSVLQKPLTRHLHPDKGRLTFYFVSRLYTLLFGVACVSSWRGTWNLLNECTGNSAKTTLATTIAASLSLAALRGFRNVCSAPFAVTVDTPNDYFEFPTMFRTNSKDKTLYVLDCVFSVVVVGSLVVFVWRGFWALLDIYIYPGDPFKSNITSLIIGYSLVALTFSLQSAARWACARLSPIPRLILADCYHLLSFVATVNLWRGIWGLLDLYLLPDNPRLGNWISHVVSITLLMLLNCSNTVLVRGVYIDAEETGGECVVFPCHYVRILYYRQRTRGRHRRALRAAATTVYNAASIPSGNNTNSVLAPLNPLEVIQEKV